MSQKTDLQATNADLQAILDLVNSLPDKVEAPTYETCTVTLSVTYGIKRYIALVLGSDGPEIIDVDSIYNYGQFTISNVLCGSILLTEHQHYGGYWYDYDSKIPPLVTFDNGSTTFNMGTVNTENGDNIDLVLGNN